MCHSVVRRLSERAGLPPRRTACRAWLRAACVAAALSGAVAGPARAGSIVDLGSLTAGTGDHPVAGLTFDAAGNLYGTAQNGGAYGGGTVFELTANGRGGFAAPTAITSFTGTATKPYASVTFDGGGNLYGTTQNTVYEMAKSGSTYGAPTTLLTASVPIGDYYYSGVVFNTAGNILFGTYNDGPNGYGGTVVSIAKTVNGYGAATELFNFNNGTGARIMGNIIQNAAGDIFGTTTCCGAGAGSVFEMVKSGSTYGAPINLANFTSAGGQPYGGLFIDANGNLFGTTFNGGANADGTVFKIADTGGVYGALQTLGSFNGSNGTNPYSGVYVDGSGNIFGTTETGTGGASNGTVFEIRDSGGTYGTIQTLATFDGTNGQNPFGTLTATADGTLIGTTQNGGTAGVGTVFVLSTAAPAPEPAPLALLAVGMMGLGLARRRSAG